MAKQATAVCADPAVEAWRRVDEAGVNDSDYLSAIEDFEKAVPTTMRGVLLKRRLERTRMAALAEGDSLTWGGRIHAAWYRRTIDDALAQIARKTKRSE